MYECYFTGTRVLWPSNLLISSTTLVQLSVSDFALDVLIAQAETMNLEEPGDKRRPHKAERRLAKKQNRIKHALLSKGVEICDKPTKILCLYNAGLDNGVTREEVFSLVKDYGDVLEIIMIAQKPYTFVMFSGVDQAVRAQEALTGVKISSAETQAAVSATLHTLYVTEAPREMIQTEPLPLGLILKEDFITAEYEAELLAAIDWDDVTPAGTGAQKDLKHRKVKHYGYEFLYGINNVDPSRPLPQGVPPVCDRLLERALTTGLVKHHPDQLTVNQYSPGQGIPPHVDTPSAFEDGLMSLSLGSQVVMDFQHPDGRHVSVLLPRRSLLVMTGESRYIWSHGITRRKSDIVNSPGKGLTLATRGTRTSLTFRKIIPNQNPHRCEHMSVADSREKKGENPVSEEEAAILETQHVHKVYEDIASHFSQTRHSAWPRIAEFIRGLPQGSLLADIGCGNGKYLGLNKDIFEVCSDRSSNLAAICAERGHQTFVGDMLSVPLRTGVFDVCICIAVIHHLSTQLRRENALRELVRILTPGGQLLVYVWAMEQERGKVKSKYLKGSSRKGCDGQGNTETSSDMVKDTSKQCSRSTDAVEGQSNSETAKTDKKLLLTNDIHVGDSCSTTTDSSSDGCNTQMLTGAVANLTLPSSSCLVATTTHSSSDIIDSTRVTNSDKKCKFTDNVNNVEAVTKNLSVHVNRTEFKDQDLLVPWQLKTKSSSGKADTRDSSCENVESVPEQHSNTYHRYYHVFKQGELELLCEKLPNVIVKNSYYDQGNWCVFLEKTKTE